MRVSGLQSTRVCEVLLQAHSDTLLQDAMKEFAEKQMSGSVVNVDNPDALEEADTTKCAAFYTKHIVSFRR